MIDHQHHRFSVTLPIILILTGAPAWEVQLPAVSAAEASLVAGLQVSSSQPQARYEVRAIHDPDGTGRFYMGREIAQVMGAGGFPGSIARAAKLRSGLRWSLTPRSCVTEKL